MRVYGSTGFESIIQKSSITKDTTSKVDNEKDSILVQIKGGEMDGYDVTTEFVSSEDYIELMQETQNAQ